MSSRPGIGKRFSHDRFTILPDSDPNSNGNPNGSGMSKDATIDIPLTAVPSVSQTGARKPEDGEHYFEKGHDGVGDAGGEGAERQIGGRRRAHGHHHYGDRSATSDEDGTITRMGRFYNKILNFSVVTRYFIYVLPLALLFAVPIIVGAVAAPTASIGGVRIVWFFAWVEIVWLSLWVSKAVAHYVPFVFQFLCGIVSSGTRKYALILRALEIPFSLVGWAITSLATFIPVMTRNPDNIKDPRIQPWQTVVNNILFACFISSLILAAEKILVQLISISYHRKQFDSKIQESKRNVHLISMLYAASRKMFPEYCKEFEMEDYIINDSIMGITGKKKGHGRSGSASPMRLIQNVGQNVGRVGDKITAAFGHVAQEITGKQVFNSTSAHSIVILALEKRKSSEALARRLWMSFVLQGRDALYLDDLYDVFGPDHRAEAEGCMAALDRDDNGDISLDEMILTVTEFGKARQSMSKSMHDVDQAINVLDNLLLAVVFILVVLVFVAFLNKGFGTTLAAGATALLSLSFVFAATAQEVLGSCIYLFVKHPYDVGDRVHINDNELMVEHISLLFTVFRNIQHHKTIQVPNIVLNTQWIENVTRSKAMREQITLTCDFGTSFGDIQLLKREMQAFVRAKDNARDFGPDVDIEVSGLGEMNKLELKVEIHHKSNWHNEVVRATRRSKFLCALVLAIKKIPIYGPGGGDAALGDISKPSYSVSISHEQAQHSKDEYAANKEAKRMIPTDQMDEALSADPAPLSPRPGAGTGAAAAAAAATSASGLTYRGSTASNSTSNVHSPHNPEAAFASALNSRPPMESTPSSANVTQEHLIRGPSTGHRRLSQNPNQNPSGRQGMSPNTPATEYQQYDYENSNNPFRAASPPAQMYGQPGPSSQSPTPTGTVHPATIIARGQGQGQQGQPPLGQGPPRV
ncbi:serine/threonine protein kinase [Trichophyton violaceum]|uniref:Mechanosensitive ion channel protein n=1 Tax=Trichophyton violaceum TaxID=34388 RepID=A0A178FJK4_TRIVO|nr:serine/threonine protein kinase [Trichophyton violaceum]